MADVFQAVADSLAALIGTTSEIAGFMLGFTVILVFLVGFVLILGTEALNSKIAAAIVGFPIAFVALVGWWPNWTILFIVVMIIAAWAFRDAG